MAHLILQSHPFHIPRSACRKCLNSSCRLVEAHLGVRFVPASVNLPYKDLNGPSNDLPEFIEGMTTKHPVFPAFQSPSYSNVAFSLLAYATEAITGKKFPQILQTKVFSALNMTRSFYEKPSDELGVIPGDPTTFFWNVSAGELNPGAGFYSSPFDLAIFGRAVLSSKLLTPSQTRRWMKPLSHTADPFASVGAPWEIARYTLPSNPYKTVDLYAKSGAFGYYTAYLVLAPDQCSQQFNSIQFGASN
jgi:CubicO group peptidase (beta-lactamase class C family)